MTIAIADEQTVRTVGALRQTLLEVIAPGTRAVLDISGVTEADLAFVQLIESARRHASTNGCELSLASAAPPPVREVLDCAGFAPAAHPFWNQGAPTP